VELPIIRISKFLFSSEEMGLTSKDDGDSVKCVESQPSDVWFVEVTPTSGGSEPPTSSTQNGLEHVVQVSAGYSHTAMLRSDGKVFAFGKNESGQCKLPKDSGYAQVSAGGSHTVLLDKNGDAKGVGSNEFKQCNIPERSSTAAWRYVQVSAGSRHTVLLRSDGHVQATGCNREGQCDIPLLDTGLSYLQVSAGGHHTVLLRSDGQAFTVGAQGEISIPSVSKHQTWADWAMTKPVLPDGVEYVSDDAERPVSLLTC